MNHESPALDVLTTSPATVFSYTLRVLAMLCRKKTSLLLLALCLLTAALFGCDKAKVANKAEIDKPAPDFALYDNQGKLWELKDQRGKLVFINFWATWCPPCREEMPSMQRLYSALPHDKFEMLTILRNDDPVAAEKFARQLGATFPVLIDYQGQIGDAYGLTGVPETFLVDQNGILRAKFIGPLQWDAKEARQLIDTFL